MVENLFISNFKKAIVFLIKIAFFILFMLPLVYFLGNKYAAATTENKVNAYNQQRWEEFYSLPKGSIDMVFLGSSHSYCTFDPEIIDKELGTNSYQMGMPLQHMDSTYYTFKEVLNYQAPKTVVVEVYWDMLDDKFELTQAGYLFQVMQNKQLEQEYIKEVFPLSEKFKYNINIFRYQQDYFAYRNARLKEKLENKFSVYIPQGDKQTGIEKYGTKGYIYSNYNMLPDEFDKTNQYKELDGSNWEYENTQVNYLFKISDYCNQNDIGLVLVTAPIANVSMDYIKDYSSINAKISDIAKKCNAQYLDFNIVNLEEKILDNDNFRDDAHLNHSGAIIVNKYFTKWLNKIYK